ncbi:replication protein A 32 kDa subunit-like isoform X2 [Xiphias gladius]|uniref:replication protein A 32 kDa subunit-like isoform X2 n=1 Tax=Xiphias gladius TaxID=8245 RepID=UPI001A98FC78|nr:replication protein A 32 kDa subunit-like isoform X2 [Xiphias gladius]
MWNQVCSQSTDGIISHKAVVSKKSTLQILPCTVSQLLSARQVSNDTFAISDWELNQVSAVGVIRGFFPFVTNIQYSVDDMTGPPLNVKQWVNTEDCALMTFASPGTYVKVTGNLRSFSGQRSLLSINIRCIKDLNEITSHMLEVVQAHMQLFGKVLDVNMNTTLSSLPGRCSGGNPDGILPNGLSSIQGQVLHVIRNFPDRDDGISFHDLKTQLDYLSMIDIRSSLAFLINEGHVFSTIDEHHFKSTEP